MGLAVVLEIYIVGVVRTGWVLRIIDYVGVRDFLSVSFNVTHSLSLLG